MKKVIVLIVSVVLLVCLLAGCSNTLTANIVESDVSKYAKVSLEENQTTGYAWTCKISDESKLELASDEYVESSKDNLGAGGMHNFVFKALSDGDVDVTFTYARSFEEGSEESVLVYKYSIADMVPVLIDIVDKTN